MFIKIVYYDADFGFDDGGRAFLKSKELNSEFIHECDVVQIVQDTRVDRDVPEKADPEAVPVMCIYLGKSGDPIEIPLNSRNQAFEVFVMNNEGKTIDRYAY